MRTTYLNPEDTTAIEQVHQSYRAALALTKRSPIAQEALEQQSRAFAYAKYQSSVSSTSRGEHIAAIKNLRQHPHEFYQKCRFVILRMMPDTNGLGQPDICMAKHLRN